MKKGAGQRVLRLVENPDILAAAGKLKKRAVVAGFALETNDTEQNALGKLKKKRLDMIIANTLSSKTNPFGDNITDIILLDRRGGRYIYRRKSKRKLSKIILDKVLRFTI
jgi:phosphopantothenoylcysteine decarboxylase/phosphopantothenate--cysteine ligase